MPTVSKTALKSRLFDYLRDVEQFGEPIIVTSYGVPFACITRVAATASVTSLFADVRGGLAFKGSPDAPTSDEWSDA